MSSVTEILSAIERGDPGATDRLLPVVYDELRGLAAQRLREDRPGNTLQATALVNEALLRLLGGDGSMEPVWNSRHHFFAAAAEAMRRILVDAARRRRALKRGGGAVRQNFKDSEPASPTDDQELLAIHDVLDRLAATDPAAAQLVKLRFFAGQTMSEAATVLGISVRSAHDVWTYARAWLRRELQEP